MTDHNYLKECIDVLTDEEVSKRSKLSVARGFLDALEKHSTSENKVLYEHLLHKREFHEEILEGKVEHGIADQKVKMLKPKIKRARSLSDQLAAELKVLADVVGHHIKEEEKELLPKIRKHVDRKVLDRLGAQFIRVRKFTPEDVEGAPEMWLQTHNIKRPPQPYPIPMMFPAL